MSASVQCNRTALYIYQEMQGLLAQQLYKPVLWQNSIMYLLENGVQTFIEMGPQNILKTLMPEISGQTRVYAHDEKVDRMTIRDHIAASSAIPVPKTRLRQVHQPQICGLKQ